MTRSERRTNRSRPAYLYAKSFAVLVDSNPRHGNPVIGLQVEPVAGSSFVMPIAFESARDIANMILQTLAAV